MGFLEGEFLVSDVDIAVDVPSLLDVVVARANEFLAGKDVSLHESGCLLYGFRSEDSFVHDIELSKFDTQSIKFALSTTI